MRICMPDTAIHQDKQGLELLNLPIVDERSIENISDLLFSAKFGPFDIVTCDQSELKITLTRPCFDDWTAMTFTKTLMPGFLKITYPLVRSQLTISGLKWIKRHGPEHFECAEFEYIKKHLSGFKLKAEPLSWEFAFEGQPRGSLKDINILTERGRRIHMTNLGLVLAGIGLAAWVAAVIWFRIF